MLKSLRIIAQKNPNQIALECGNLQLSYGDIDTYSTEIADLLIGQRLTQANVVTCLQRSPELVLALLGIMKSGCVFVPVDPRYPIKRISYMIQEVEASWVITSRDYLPVLDQVIAEIKKPMNVLVLPEVREARELGEIYLAEVGVAGNNECNKKVRSKNTTKGAVGGDTEVLEKSLEGAIPEMNKHMYIYYTSGSTGQPKGILGRSRSVQHFINWEVKELGITSEFRVSQLTSPAFDAYLRDVFVTLAVGATVCIPESEEIIFNQNKLVHWIDEQKITLVHMTPSLFKQIMVEVDDPQLFSSLKYILLAGEMLRGDDLTKFYQLFGSRIQLYNLYGPSETTMVKLFYRVSEADLSKIHIPVGKPMDYTKVIILDKYNKQCETGVVGELYIRTPFITSGYYKKPELTKEVFIPNPFNNDSRDIIYKTGDLARKLPDGNIELVGRIDHQVKIRGIRIEPGEIESLLLKHPDVKDAIILPKTDSHGDVYLCAYILVKDSIGEFNQDDLKAHSEDSTEAILKNLQNSNYRSVQEHRSYLSSKLPDHMIPAEFIFLSQLPYLSNGKVDRKQLLTIEAKVKRTQEYVAPQNALQAKLAMIWADVLGVSEVGIRDNFIELGGHSLKAITILARLNKELNVDFLLKEIGELTIEELA